MSQVGNSNTFRAGWIYVLQHNKFPGYLKIGFTERSVEERVIELEAATGVMSGFKIEYAALVENPRQVENYIHKKLSTHREEKNKEFFRIETELAIKEIKNIISQTSKILHENINFQNEENLLIENKKELWKKSLIENLKYQDEKFHSELDIELHNFCKLQHINYKKQKKKETSRIENVGLYSCIASFFGIFIENDPVILLIGAAGISYQWYNNANIDKENDLIRSNNKKLAKSYKEEIKIFFEKFNLICPQNYLEIEDEEYNDRNYRIHNYIKDDEAKYADRAHQITIKISYLKIKNNIITGKLFDANNKIIFDKRAFKGAEEIIFLKNDTVLGVLNMIIEDNNSSKLNGQPISQIELQTLKEATALTDQSIIVGLEIQNKLDQIFS